jgi:peptidyl-prolyl cis-trans isomerase SurA
MARRNPVDTKDEAVRKQVLEAMINDKLVLAQAELDSIEVSEERVESQLDTQIRYMEKQYGSRERLERDAGMTVAQMKREYRNDVRKRIMIQDLQAMKFGQLKVTRREVTEFYMNFRDSLPQVPGQIELRQIVVYPRVLETFKKDTRKLAESILDSIKNGASFEEMAGRYSNDPGSAKNGGKLGLARRGVFVKEFEEAAFSLKPGEISGIVESSFGFHIIKQISKKGEAIEAQHILFKVKKTGASDQAAIDKLTQLREEALAGKDFSILAGENSEDDLTKNIGGSLGVVEVEQLAKEVYAAQEGLETEGITEPIKIELEGDYAYAIFQVVRRIPPHQPDLQEDYQRIEAYSRNLKQRELYETWIEEIRGNIYWKITI